MKASTTSSTGLSRRSFLRNTGAATVGLALAAPHARVLGANDDIRVAVVGVHGRGGDHINEYSRIAGTRVVALCDVDRDVLAARAEALAKKDNPVKTFVDVRELLDSGEVDAISVATTNHSHSLITVWGCQAGKDVYVEKPCSHNVFEGRKCVEAARKYRRIVQHGTQSRADSRWAQTVAAIQSGKYGKLLVSKGYCCKPRWSIGFKPYAEPPANLDFNLWLGPAPAQPFHGNLVHYNWHWFWDFGNGDIGNQGVHQMDIARWAIQGATLPTSVVSMGGRYVDGPNFKDQGQTPNMELSVMEFGDTLLVFETRGLVKNGTDFTNKVDNEFYMEGGVIRGHKFYPNGSSEGQSLESPDVQRGPGGHFENFILAVRSRKVDEQHADIQEGHYSAALCHLGNIPYRLGVEVPFNYRTDRLGTSQVVSDAMMTVLENTKSIGVDPARNTYCLGPKLQFDPARESFKGNVAADLLLTRFYREPFVVPEKV
ncbi:MAG: Gfo/Idh/MocA family oxidoreductase [Verrucomicrobiales bacterium]|nr:Gfo/Idh/MocA family oxidoreductase [Verrucomicrobiales bacterium]